MGVCAFDMAGKDIPNDMGNGMRPNCRHITFTIANDAIIRDQLNKDKIATTKSGWGITDNKNFTIL